MNLTYVYGGDEDLFLFRHFVAAAFVASWCSICTHVRFLRVLMTRIVDVSKSVRKRRDRERGREGGRERDAHSHKRAHTHASRETKRETETDRARDKETQTDRERDRHRADLECKDPIDTVLLGICLYDISAYRTFE